MVQISYRLGEKGLFCISFHADVNKQRLAVFINRKASYVIVVVAVAVVAGFDSQTQTAVLAKNRSGAWIVKIRISEGLGSSYGSLTLHE